MRSTLPEPDDVTSSRYSESVRQSMSEGKCDLCILNIWVLPRVVVVLRLDRAGRADRQQPQVVVHRKVLSNALRAGHVHHLRYSLIQINVVFLINPLQPIPR